ncbi:cupin domain-containing protein [Roseivirga sp. E12]|uniref:cupin domain-containing protein n=1 Tax=Roseivirga sp. E12 TaxID=2819237 RepID=UPI001ABCEDD9|nr:cupin domain-containing protein [Roseivirga sp. E12]MBO3699674.1 cupin domain-containing protein [Roseivirga sp. E12]
MTKDAEYWIEKLNLQAHPEGGYFNETYRSEESVRKSVLPERYGSSRTFGTSIYFLLTTKSVSNFHRLSSDEIWHYHQGGVAIIHMISKNGELTSSRIGSDLEAGESLQVIIPKGTWFAAEVVKEVYILVGCTVAPGFEFEDFELADRDSLTSAYPQHQTLIRRFTNNGR